MPPSVRVVRRILRWVLYIVGGLFALILLGILVGLVVSEIRLRTTYEVTVAPLVIPTDQASIEYGEHLATTWALCTECHGDDLAGDEMFDDMFGRIIATNLTSGEGGIGEFYTDEDWVRAIRHGVNPSGKSVLLMDYALNRLTDEELGAIIAYMKSVPPVDNVLPSSQIKFPGRMFVVMAPDLVFMAHGIDHTAPRPPDVPAGPTAAYGEHIAVGLCDFCHGDNFAGGEQIFPEEGDDFVLSRNLTPAGNLANWTEADFFTSMRTGVTPEGHQLDNEVMPWEDIGTLHDDELRAIWLFLQSLPPAQPDSD